MLQLILAAVEYLLQLAFLYLSHATYLTIFNWFWNVRVRFRTLLRTLLSSFVILLVTTHSDEQLGQSCFLLRRYIRVIWFTRDTRLRLIWPTRKQNRATSVPTLLSITEATHQNGAQNSRHANRSWLQRIVGMIPGGSVPGEINNLFWKFPEILSEIPN